ncbi:MAG: hypothetical protein U0167_13740 [bacterium]
MKAKATRGKAGMAGKAKRKAKAIPVKAGKTKAAKAKAGRRPASRAKAPAENAKGKRNAPASTSGGARLVTKPSEIDRVGRAWVLHFPRFGKEGEHFHTYGQLTPYFEGLTKGKLLGTRCVNPKCPVSHGHGELWLPPRADCPDCHQPMEWGEIRSPSGYIYTFTKVERGGTGLEIETPYYQIDVKIQGVCTIVKSWLVDRRPIKIGDRVRARFRTGRDATHTCLDLSFELE